MADDAGIALRDLPDATIVVDAARRVAACNEVAAALLGRDVADLVGTRLDDHLAPVDGEDAVWLRDWHPSAWLRSATRIREHEVGLRRADGEVLRARVTGRYRRDGAGRLVDVLLVVRPAHPRGPHTPTGMEVVSTVSHELRSPLTSVKGYTSLLLNRWDRMDDAQKRSMLEQINLDADRVTRLITELLDISRLETGRLVLRRQEIELPALVAGVLEKVRFGHPDLDCSVSFPDGFPRVYADPDKVVQVVTNLVENAAKYASPVGMQVEGSVGDTEVAVEVRDRGEGIPGDDLAKVFTRFYRRDHGKPSGSGLGLWISRGLIEAHGGRLTATSIPGQGSVFRFTLPTDAFERLHG